MADTAAPHLLIITEHQQKGKENTMKFAEIDREFTKRVAEWLAKGYVFNGATMNGSQGEIAKVDLTSGKEIIRVMIDTFYGDRDEDSLFYKGVEIIVGRPAENVTPHSERHDTIWNSRLEVLEEVKFYKVGDSRDGGEEYGTKEQAKRAANLHYERYSRNHKRTDGKDITEKALPIAKRYLHRVLPGKRIRPADITVKRWTNGYSVHYKGTMYQLH